MHERGERRRSDSFRSDAASHRDRSRGALASVRCDGGIPRSGCLSAENGGGVIRSGRMPRVTETGAGELWPARGAMAGFRGVGA